MAGDEVETEKIKQKRMAIEESLIDKIEKELIEAGKDITTLTVITKTQDGMFKAETDIDLTGDITTILPSAEGKLNEQLIDIHQKNVSEAVKSWREVIHGLLDIINLVKGVR